MEGGGGVRDFSPSSTETPPMKRPRPSIVLNFKTDDFRMLVDFIRRMQGSGGGAASGDGLSRMCDLFSKFLSFKLMGGVRIEMKDEVGDIYLSDSLVGVRCVMGGDSVGLLENFLQGDSVALPDDILRYLMGKIYNS